MTRPGAYGLAFAVVAVTMVGLVATAAPAPGTGATSRYVIPKTVTTMSGFRRETGRRVVEQQNRIDDAMAPRKASKIFGSTYEGDWYYNGRPAVVFHVDVTQTATPAMIQHFHRELTSWARAHVTITKVRYSRATLQRYVNTLEQFIGPSGKSEIKGLRFSTEDDAVVLTVDRGHSGVLGAVERLVPVDALRVRWTPGVAEAA